MIDIKARLDIADNDLTMIHRKYQYKMGSEKWSCCFLIQIQFNLKHCLPEEMHWFVIIGIHFRNIQQFVHE